MRKEFLEIGKIVGVHGIKGMLRVQFWCDDFNFFSHFKNFYLRNDKKIEKETAKLHGNIALLKVKNIDSIEQAEALRGEILLIKRDDSPVLKGRYFIEELIGCNVFNSKTGEQLGTVSNVTQYPANDIWHIKRNEKEFLFPAVDEFIVKVDIDSSKAFINPPKGIFEDEN